MFKIIIPILLCLGLSACSARQNGVAKGFTPWLSEIPLRDFWEKPNMTDKTRKQDWVMCGGDDKGEITINTRLSARNMETLNKKADDISQCMHQKDYQLTDIREKISYKSP